MKEGDKSYWFMLKTSETTLMFTKVKVPFSGMQSMTNDIHFPPCLLQQIGSYPHTLYHAPALTG